ncbi:MAG: hypothetical protein EOO68_07905 [Moraxellaceae bacterium]|nr:MAG: hypothetical protein EOO68_07905 [Moraxellaceae bacterium]
MKKLFLSLLVCVLGQHASAAEIVTNSKGQKIELNANKTWNFVKGNPVDVKVSIAPNEKTDPPITKTMLLEKIDMISREVMAGLKNEYSYVPREIIVVQQPIVLMIDIKYTAANSYGADTIGTISRGLRPNDDGKY